MSTQEKTVYAVTESDIAAYWDNPAEEGRKKWADLTQEERDSHIERVAKAIGHSTVPAAVDEVLYAVLERERS